MYSLFYRLGFFFAPLLPCMVLLKFFGTFYLKKVNIQKLQFLDINAEEKKVIAIKVIVKFVNTSLIFGKRLGKFCKSAVIFWRSDIFIISSDFPEYLIHNHLLFTYTKLDTPPFTYTNVIHKTLFFFEFLIHRHLCLHIHHWIHATGWPYRQLLWNNHLKSGGWVLIPKVYYMEWRFGNCKKWN